MKKLVSVVLTLSLLLSSVAVFSITAHAAGNHYEAYRYAVDSNGNWANCTYWAWQYAYEFDGVELPCWGDARYWYGGANGVYPCDKTPSAHSILCTGDGYYGHVAYVSDYNSSTGKVYVWEGGVAGTADGRWHGWIDAPTSGLQGYIHLTGSIEPSAPIVSVTIGNNNEIDVTWNNTGASNYYVFIFNVATQSQVENTPAYVGRTFSMHYQLSDGNYIAYVTSMYDNGVNLQGSCAFSLAPPSAPTVSVAIGNNNEIDVTWNDTGAASYYVYIYNVATQSAVANTGANVGTSLSAHYQLSDGNYIAYVTANYSNGVQKSGSYAFSLIKVMRGDFDGDEQITVSDALAVLRIAAKLVVETPEAIAIGDIDGDGVITVSDALAILRVAAKLTDSL